MKSTFAAGLCSTLAVLAISASASAQTLGDVARQEEARRKTVKTPSKVYTNDNLKPDISPPPPPASAATGAQTPPPDATEAAPGPAPAGDADAAKGEAFWKKKLSDARDALDRAKTFAAALQVQINSLTTDFTNRDDPAQRAVIGQNRDKALAELDRLQMEITADTKAIAAIQEDGRKAGVPAAWLR